jgi:hypothetical protein
MALDSLASVAHAAGFAMVPEDDAAAAEQNEQAEPVALHLEGSGRWQGSTQPIIASGQAGSQGGMFDWIPSLSWRSDGR